MTRHLIAEGGDLQAGKRRVPGRIHGVRDDLALRDAADVASAHDRDRVQRGTSQRLGEPIVMRR